MTLTLAALASKARDVWVPRWFDLFSDASGGFYERLDHNLMPINMPRRLVTQCRQIMVYSMADRAKYQAKLDEAFAAMRAAYEVDSVPVFSTQDRYYDLYALAFVLSACAAYNTEDARAYADTILEFIQINFAADIGFYDALDLNLEPRSGIRRQNPHMHLLEGAMAMIEVSKDPGYRTLADDMVALFLARFFDGKNLYEFFDDDLRDPQNVVEAGHHAEWVWLLHRYQDLTGPDQRLQTAQTALYAWAKQYGIDRDFGGVFNGQRVEGTVTDSSKRIWPQMEMLRAAAIMQDEATVQNLLIVLNDYYFSDDGIWTESLKEDLSVDADYLPGTTPYHIYPVLKSIAA
ncbi:MAG TPA: AGE family epimerase/isomerase [Alphaproteobacteria bacterium]